VRDEGGDDTTFESAAAAAPVIVFRMDHAEVRDACVDATDDASSWSEQDAFSDVEWFE